MRQYTAQILVQIENVKKYDNLCSLQSSAAVNEIRLLRMIRQQSNFQMNFIRISKRLNGTVIGVRWLISSAFQQK